MLLTAEDRLSRARMVLERRALAPADLLAPEIAESWTRCLAAGLDPNRAPVMMMASRHALEEARARHATARRLALAEMSSLHQQIAGTSFVIAFADPDGMLLDAVADESFAASAPKAGIRPGAIWTETICGTNALGTAAATRRPVSVHGGEHFFATHTKLTCAAVPILAPDGGLAGVLDASSDCGSRQQHTSALVAMAATQIENGLLRDQHVDSFILAFHSRAEYVHTLSAGLIALDEAGTVRAVNRAARFLLQGLPAEPGRHAVELLRTPMSVLLDRDGGRGAGRGMTVIEDRVGSRFACLLTQPPARPSPRCSTRPGVVAAHAFVADAPDVAALVRRVELAAKRGLPLLIRGETGTGKEALARHAHISSGRRGTFVPVNCAALPEALTEAELFGHADGAFTGARRGGAPGLVAEADGGTLFLDEIGEMRPMQQAVLLRLLDDWTIRPVGGGKRRVVDVLLVAATNADLARQVAEQRFRADLLYRLDTIEACLPRLADRADFATVVAHVLAALAPEATIAPEAVARLASHPWPGNIRELRSVLARLTLADPSVRITAEMITLRTPASADATLHGEWRERIRSSHAGTGGNVAETARRLGVSRNTVYRAIK